MEKRSYIARFWRPLLVIAFLACLAFLFSIDAGHFTLSLGAWQIQTSALVAIIGLAILFVAVFFLLRIFRTFVHLPKTLQDNFHHRRRQQNLRDFQEVEALVRAGDAQAAKALALLDRKMERAGCGKDQVDNQSEISIMRLRAQLARSNKDDETYENTLRDLTLSKREGDKLEGFYGLFQYAKRKGDFSQSLICARNALRISETLPWAQNVILSHHVMEEEWEKARQTLEDIKYILPKSLDLYHEKRAALEMSQAQALSKLDPMHPEIRERARKALAQKHNFSPAFILLIRTYLALQRPKKALQLFEHAWQKNPCLELSFLYVEEFIGRKDSAFEKAKDIADNAKSEESAFFLAHVAAKVRAFDAARTLLKPLVEKNSTRALALLATCAQAENQGNLGLELMERAEKGSSDACYWFDESCAILDWRPLHPHNKLFHPWAFGKPPISLKTPSLVTLYHRSVLNDYTNLLKNSPSSSSSTQTFNGANLRDALPFARKDDGA